MKLTAKPSERAEHDEEEFAFLQSVATDLLEMLEDAEKAIAKRYHDQLMDMDEALGLWELLPAKVRTAIKRGDEGPQIRCVECGVLGHTRHCSIGGRFK